MSVKAGPIPEGGLLNTYTLKLGCYTDCFWTDVSGQVTLNDLISTFFNTPVLRLERKILGIFGSRPSTNNDVVGLASGSSDTLAIWEVEARDDNQLLLAVGNGPIRTWLMASQAGTNENVSRIYFGSAVLPMAFSPSGEPKMSRTFHMLLGFHKLYSCLLLWSTKRRLLSL